MQITKAQLEDMLEKALHNAYPHKTVSNQYGHILKEIKSFNVTLTAHNGRLTKIEKWQERLKGARTATNAIWGVLGVFIIASTFGLFNMYVAFQGIDYKIQNAVTTAISDATFYSEEIK